MPVVYFFAPADGAGAFDPVGVVVNDEPAASVLFFGCLGFLASRLVLF